MAKDIKRLVSGAVLFGAGAFGLDKSVQLRDSSHRQANKIIPAPSEKNLQKAKLIISGYEGLRLVSPNQFANATMVTISEEIHSGIYHQNDGQSLVEAVPSSLSAIIGVVLITFPLIRRAKAVIHRR